MTDDDDDAMGAGERRFSATPAHEPQKLANRLRSIHDDREIKDDCTSNFSRGKFFLLGWLQLCIVSREERFI